MTTLVKQRGRPRAFDETKALNMALQVFWEKGYEGASLSDLTEALGINKPSLYAAFGNKEELFRKTLAKYVEGPVSYAKEALNAPTARQTVEDLLMKSAEFLTGQEQPRGCLLVKGALAGGESVKIIQHELSIFRREFENALRNRFERAKENGELDANLDTAALAKYVATIHQGMSVQAIGGATREELIAVVQTALRNWPQ